MLTAPPGVIADVLWTCLLPMTSTSIRPWMLTSALAWIVQAWPGPQSLVKSWTVVIVTPPVTESFAG